MVAGLGFAGVSLVGAGVASATDLEGSWHGGGSVSFGANEEAVRCRAHYRRTSSRRYRLSATCTTGATRVTQSAVLRRVSRNEYEGRFYNSEYNVSGSIYIQLNGSRQNVTLESSRGSADLNLRKR